MTQIIRFIQPIYLQKNDFVNSHNNAVFHGSPTVKAQVKCIDLIVGDISNDLKKKIRQKIPDDPTKTMGLINEISPAVGAKYNLTTNVKVSDDMTNRAKCKIILKS